VQANFPEDPVQPDPVVLGAPVVEELDDCEFINGLMKELKKRNGLKASQRS
jgi:hypothetical protein